MALLRKKPLLIPAAAFLAAVLALGLTLLFLTARNLRETRARLVENLYQRGMVLIRTVEAGARTGMMSADFDKEFTARLLTEVSAEPDVDFIYIVGNDKEIIAGSLEGSRGIIPDLPPGLGDGIPRMRIEDSGSGPRMLIFKKFRPPAESRRGHMRGRMMGRSDGEVLPESHVVLSLLMNKVREAEAQALRNAFLSGLILLLAGVGGILFFGIIQNYYLLRRTLAATRSYADRIVDSMADGLVAVDPGGTIIVINRETSRLFSDDDSVLAGRDIKEAVHEIAGDIDRALVKGETVLDGTATVVRGGRKMRLNYNITPLKEEETISGAVVLLRDIGEVEDLREKLKEGEKLAALGQMAAAVAHEVRNPLSSIKGLAQLLSKRFGEGTSEKKHTQVITEEVNRLNRFVEELLVFVRPTRPRKVQIDLGDLLGEVISLVSRDAAGRNITIETDIHEDIPPILADRDLFRRAMLNIIINSMEAMGARGGSIGISAQPSAEGGIRLMVADTGPGIPPGDENRIFESFYSSKPGGTGLGLPIVRQVMEGHGWRYELKNRPEGGAVNIIDVPAQKGEVP